MAPPNKPTANVVKVPNTPAKAFDPKRPASNLVLAQVALFEAALDTRKPMPVRSLKARAVKPPRRRAAAPAVTPRTEGAAARRVQELHAQLVAHPAPVIPRVARPAAPRLKRGKVSR